MQLGFMVGDSDDGGSGTNFSSDTETDEDESLDFGASPSPGRWLYTCTCVPSSVLHSADLHWVLLSTVHANATRLPTLQQLEILQHSPACWLRDECIEWGGKEKNNAYEDCKHPPPFIFFFFPYIF